MNDISLAIMASIIAVLLSLTGIEFFKKRDEMFRSLRKFFWRLLALSFSNVDAATLLAMSDNRRKVRAAKIKSAGRKRLVLLKGRKV